MREATSLCLNRCFAEFRQQRINGGAVLAEPSVKYVPIDCSGGLALVWPIADAALSLDRQPAFKSRAQALDTHRLHQTGVHARRQAALFFALHGVGSDCNDRRAEGAALSFGGAQPARQLMALHVWHMDIGEHGGVATARPCLQRIKAVLHSVSGDPEQLEPEHEHLSIHGMIFDPGAAPASALLVQALVERAVYAPAGFVPSLAFDNDALLPEIGAALTAACRDAAAALAFQIPALRCELPEAPFDAP